MGFLCGYTGHMPRKLTWCLPLYKETLKIWAVSELFFFFWELTWRHYHSGLDPSVSNQIFPLSLAVSSDQHTVMMNQKLLFLFCQKQLGVVASKELVWLNMGNWNMILYVSFHDSTTMSAKEKEKRRYECTRTKRTWKDSEAVERLRKLILTPLQRGRGKLTRHKLSLTAKVSKTQELGIQAISRGRDGLQLKIGRDWKSKWRAVVPQISYLAPVKDWGQLFSLEKLNHTALGFSDTSYSWGQKLGTRLKMRINENL